MAALATRPRRLTALERTLMTPEQELERLILEQEADDIYWVRPQDSGVSLDMSYMSQVHDGPPRLVGEMVGRDPWDLVDAAIDLGLDPTELAFAGDLVDCLQPRRGDVLTDPRNTDHGTINAYANAKCRCLKCRAANAQYMRDYRAARKAA
jgi:hypothetical protein